MKRFIQPIKKYYLGKIRHGSPYFYPWNFNQTILTIRKERPRFLKCKYFKLFGHEISYGWPIAIVKYGLGWKDKNDTPRFEWCPSFQIYFFAWQFCIWWCSPDGNNDQYYEQKLWCEEYCGGDVDNAKATWGWVDSKTKKSTWNDKYITE